METTIAQSINVADEKAKYDAACKRLLSEKIILAWIMKHCMKEFQNVLSIIVVVWFLHSMVQNSLTHTMKKSKKFTLFGFVLTHQNIERIVLQNTPLQKKIYSEM